MNAMYDKEPAHQDTKTFQGDGFIIENYIIKGIEKRNNIGFTTIGEGIMKSLNEAANNIAQIDAETGLKRTFKDVKERSIRLALWMRKEGIKSGDIITLCSSNHLDAEIIIIAISFIGAIYNAFPHDLNLDTARCCVKLIEPRVVFVYKNKIDILREAVALENQTCKIILLGEDSSYESFEDILKIQSFSEIENFQELKTVDPKSLCTIMPTSGTTGYRKFASQSHENIMSRFSVEFNQPNEIITLICLNHEWGFYFRCALHELLLKNTKIFHRNFEPNEIFGIIEKYKVDQLILNSYKVLILSHADKAREYNLNSVSLIVSGGCRLSQKVIDKIHKIFPNAHHQWALGSTEIGTISSYTKKCRNPQSQGTILPNLQLKIIDIESGLVLGPNKAGEVFVKSPFAMVSYYKNPSQTAVVYDDKGWFHTEDEGYYDENGEIVIVGRLKNIIKYRGTHIHASDFEQILMRHPDIVEAAVIAIPHDVYAEQPVACIQTVRGSKITEDDVLKLTSELKYKDTFKNWIIFVDELPRTTNGKINKRILKEQITQGHHLKLSNSCFFKR